MARICGLANPGTDDTLVLEFTPAELRLVREALSNAWLKARRDGERDREDAISALRDDLIE